MLTGLKAIGIAFLILLALAVCGAIMWIISIVKAVLPVLFISMVVGIVLYYYLANKWRNKFGKNVKNGAIP